MKPYFYIIQHTDGRYYGGASWGKRVKTILTEYHTSSNLVHELGIENFELRKIKFFETDEEAQVYEARFLKRVKAASNPQWLNKNLGNTPMQTGKTWWTNGTTSTLAHVCPEGFYAGRVTVSGEEHGNYGVPKSEEHKTSLSQANKDGKGGWQPGYVPWNKGKSGGTNSLKGRSWTTINGKRVWSV